MIQINIKDLATPELERLEKRMEPQRLAAAVGPAVSRLLQRHLVAKGPNKKGWPTTNFWARAARATSWSEDPEGTRVSISQVGVRQRFYGGRIRPVKARALTIPISPVSYGRRASEFPDAFVMQTKKGAYIVQRDDRAGGKMSKAGYGTRARGLGGNAKRRLRATLNFLFKLSSGVDQTADPSVLPDPDEIARTAMAAIERAVLPR